jgi:tRNA-modifying protein YgfZ
MRDAWNLLLLDSLGVLRVRGADTVPFLQGQLSNDVTRLSAERSLRGAYHNPQGRVIALVRLVHLANDDVLAVLPRELVAPVAQRLAKFILRAKVKLADESALWSVAGLADADGERHPEAGPADLPELPQQADGTACVDGSIVIRLAGKAPRWLFVGPAAERPALEPSAARAQRWSGAQQWERLAIAAGDPQVYAPTSEHFVAQMLNLDVLGVIAFDKGCYTGQEVIARAHYRGRVKRRMQRFLTAQASPLKAADSGVLADGRSFRVVRAAQCPDGRCEFLAVTAVASAEGAPAAVGTPHGEQPQGADPAASVAETAAPLNAQQLELPYSLPA